MEKSMSLFCLSDVNAGNFIVASPIINAKSPGKKLHCKESTSVKDMKVTLFTESFETYFPSRKSIYIVSIVYEASNL